jgi:Domain of unknown function (DUF4189)/Bacterial TSP3 repeat
MANPRPLRSFTSMKQIAGKLSSVLTLAVSALGAAAVAGAPVAYADNTFVSIAFSDPEGISGSGEGMTSQEADNAAIANCQIKGGTACEFEASDRDCVALAVTASTPPRSSRGFGPTIEVARNRADNPNDPDDRIVEALCTKPVAPEKAAPAANSGADTDGDGLSDRDELSNLTNIFLPDTDLDGVKDGDEVKNGTNPLLIFDN